MPIGVRRGGPVQRRIMSIAEVRSPRAVAPSQFGDVDEEPFGPDLAGVDTHHTFSQR